ncbi:MAG: transcriptional repressor [Acidobacteria bacterium]|jgi:Fur family ferric uptake transcriptional regulator|nr:MAG: transcriptional repressor [Acidobacteriota bacterium]GIU82054.1 MAG: transcriptional repressor [Pyrinomonadaceae bacterium]
MANEKKKERFKEEKEIFENHIKKKGLRRTAQRDLILEVFLQTEEHVSSEDLYWLVQQKDKSIGYTTVYRTLKLLAEAGLAREVSFGDGKTYYEHHYKHQHHDHMICTECGKVIEFFSPEIEQLQDEMAEKHGFKPTYHNLRILGICAECQKEVSSADSVASGAQPRIRVIGSRFSK